MTDWGSADFPLCRQCHMPLIICGHCMHFDRRLNGGRGACGNQWVSDRMLKEAGSSPRCRNFRPKLRTRATWSVQPALWMVLGVAAVLAVGLPLAFLALRGSRAPDMQMQMSGPRTLAVGETSVVVLDIRDQGSQVDGQVKVALSREYSQNDPSRAVHLKEADAWSMMHPEPKPQTARKQGYEAGLYTLWYDAPQKCYPLLVRLTVTGQQPGNHILQVWATTPTGATITSQLPITVTAAQAQGAR